MKYVIWRSDVDDSIDTSWINNDIGVMSKDELLKYAFIDIEDADSNTIELAFVRENDDGTWAYIAEFYFNRNNKKQKHICVR